MKDYEWSARDAVGRLGGILKKWRKDVFYPGLSFSGKVFMEIKAISKGSIFYFINIYSSCNLAEKRELWRIY